VSWCSFSLYAVLGLVLGGSLVAAGMPLGEVCM